jgi:hypothetical protein
VTAVAESGFDERLGLLVAERRDEVEEADSGRTNIRARRLSVGEC